MGVRVRPGKQEAKLRMAHLLFPTPQKSTDKQIKVQGGIDLYMAVWRASLSYSGDAR